MRSYLGMSYLGWAFVVWLGIAGTFLVILIYRILISHKPEDELFMKPEETRRDLEHLRHTTRMTVLFGLASALSLLAILSAWALGWLQ
jgi:hypothetical protein